MYRQSILSFFFTLGKLYSCYASWIKMNKENFYKNPVNRLRLKDKILKSCQNIFFDQDLHKFLSFTYLQFE